MKRRRDRSISEKAINIKTAVISALAGIAAFFLFLAVSAFFLAVMDFPDSVYSLVSPLLIFAGTFVSGITAGYIRRKNGVLSGVLFSLPVFFLVFVIFRYCSEEISVKKTLLILIMSALSGAAGGIKGVNVRIYGKPGMFR